jgi:hypothetical protein
VTASDTLGAVGVSLLLVAFAANLLGWMDRRARLYQALNAIGAGFAATAAWLIGFLPFVVLEGTWCVVSVIALARLAPRRGADG